MKSVDSRPREGMIANLMNPWSTTFMIAFLPQFVDPHGGP